MAAPSDPTPDVDLQPTIGLGSPVPAAATLTNERFGDYVLHGELGRGGMGVVYKAYDPILERFVAVKMVLAGNLSDANELQRFRVEASAAARLQHPSIVKVHRVGVVEDRHYYAMDFIDGVSLAARVAEGPLPSKTAANYLLRVAEAIQHAHEEGILHRDLKPGNILLDRDDQPHVTDFGLAKQMTRDSGQTRTGALLGTPSYMSPEQAAGSKELSAATDVYGLGALLYELLTARPPFRGETTFDTVLQVLQNDPAPPRLLNPRVDRDLETICLKCLSKNPRDRYASAEDLAQDLRHYLSGESIQARSLNMIDYIGRTLERSQLDVEFRRYANLVLWFALIVFVMHLVEHATIVTRQSAHLIRGVKAFQFLLMLGVLWQYRRTGLTPTTMAERLLWSVWIGYVVACSMIGHLISSRFGMEVAYEGVLYPLFCVITGMAFFILGSSYWGMCYAISLAFFVAALVLPQFPSGGTLAFGGMWTLALVAIGLRLRRLGADRGEGE